MQLWEACRKSVEFGLGGESGGGCENCVGEMRAGWVANVEMKKEMNVDGGDAPLMGSALRVVIQRRLRGPCVVATHLCGQCIAFDPVSLASGAAATRASGSLISRTTTRPRPPYKLPAAPTTALHPSSRHHKPTLFHFAHPTPPLLQTSPVLPPQHNSSQ